MIPDPRAALDHGRAMGGSDARHADGGMARTDETQLAGGAAGEIEHASLHEWAAIVDTHNDASAIVLVGDLELGAEGQGAMGSSHCRGVHAFP